eukprot:TRINITY_DN73622_c0_g1_i1.p1 TRINITY_DN73622_c0_g1~~TRINITY_DN73622_c0_g1_i1.p1  ORF type:complete len:400 (+),score=126.10 TRINITY_DN73622_c0_g1_i1:77-1276(+)
MDASSLFASANLHYVQEEYEEALKHYTCAVTLQEDCAEYRTCRAACYLKLGRFAEALSDAEEALKIGPRAYLPLHRKGVALFYNGDFAAAKLAFEEAMRLYRGKVAAPAGMWLRKCDAELSGSVLPLGGLAYEASLAAAPSRPSAAAPAPAASAASAPSAAPAPAAAPAAAASSPATSAKPSSSSGAGGLSISGRKPTRREWYQNNTHVYITIFEKGVDQQKFQVDFQEKELTLSFPLPGANSGEEYQLDLQLFDAVEPENCKVEVGKMKVELALCKKTVGKQWKDLERVDEVAVLAAAEQPSYPTSSKTKRDWGQVDRDIEAELKDEKPEGDAALNKLFKEIYERADDETRRAMNKSFQTSGGTVLSTNWGEVAKADYEGKDRPTAPDGQEWRDWSKK